ncbi:MAG: hypothetical protein RL223_3406 [Pseudomonadota bacterium]
MCGAGRGAWRPARRVLLPVLMAVAGPADADSMRYCDGPAALDAHQQDGLLRVAALVQEMLEPSGVEVALIARSGLRLEWLGERHSHAGLALRDHRDGRWTVRQLYYACDERRPRLFDQGLAGFVMGTAQPDRGHYELLLLDGADGRAVARAALDDRRALGLLSADYSANAYAWSTRYQNCNQWVAELLGEAWAAPAGAPDAVAVAAAAAGDVSGAIGGPTTDPVAERRARAQAALRQAGYVPRTVELGWLPLMWVASVWPWLHTDDLPAAQWDARALQVSMPSALSAWVERRPSPPRRLALCHRDRQVVIRSGGAPLDADCTPADGDRVLQLD